MTKPYFILITGSEVKVYITQAVGFLATTKQALLLPISVLFPAELQTGQWREQIVTAFPSPVPAAPSSPPMAQPPGHAVMLEHTNGQPISAPEMPPSFSFRLILTSAFFLEGCSNDLVCYKQAHFRKLSSIYREECQQNRTTLSTMLGVT